MSRTGTCRSLPPSRHRRRPGRRRGPTRPARAWRRRAGVDRAGPARPPGRRHPLPRRRPGRHRADRADRHDGRGLPGGRRRVPEGSRRTGFAVANLHVAARVRVERVGGDGGHVHGPADPHLGPRRATDQTPRLDPELVDACMAMFLPDMPERGRAARARRPRGHRARDAARRIGSWPPWAARRDRPRSGRRRASGPSRTRVDGRCCASSGTPSEPPPSWPTPPGCRGRRRASTSRCSATPGWSTSASTPTGASTGSTLERVARSPSVPRRVLGRPPRRLGGHRRGDPTAAAPTRRSETAREARRAGPSRSTPPPTCSTSCSPTPSMFVRWMAATAEVDAQVGGTIRWTHANGDTCSGQYVELVPARRIVFTYGWERPDVEIPPGSTTVEIDLDPDDGGTDSGSSTTGSTISIADAHAGGWANYLDRLATTAEGRDPGPDPFANERVPTPAELAPMTATPHARRRPILGARRTAARPPRRHAVHDDGPALPAHPRRLLRQLRPPTGDLLVKLPEARVDELVAAGRADPFAPAGRRFREWAAIPPERAAPGSGFSTKPSPSSKEPTDARRLTGARRAVVS